MRPISELTGPVAALFCDLDGTLTTGGVVEPSTYAALTQLGSQGVAVVIVTGRPAGWGQALMTVAPVAAVVTENGGVSFIRKDGRMTKLYGVAAATIPEWRRKMHAVAVDVAQEVGVQLSSDSRYREIDLAFDWNEELSLPVDRADAAVAALRKAGFAASRSSVHVNFGPAEFDKLSACNQIITRVFGGNPDDLTPYVFLGDALNDAPMFAAFEKSVGVANVRDLWDELPATPKFVTGSREGAGARELCARLLQLTGSRT